MMGWVVNVCSWTSCLTGRKNGSQEEVVESRSKPGEELSEKKRIPECFIQQSHIISEAPKQQVRMSRDLPPALPILDVFELGLASPRKGMTRSTSRGSTKITSSTKSRQRQTQIPDRRTTYTGSPIDLRKVEGAMPGTDAAGYRRVELGADTITSRRPSTHRPSFVSMQEGDGKLRTFSQRSRLLNSYQDTLIAYMDDDEEDYDSESLRSLRRRSDSAPIPLRSLSMSHTIRRKPVTPKTSISFSRPSTVAGLTMETFSEQPGTEESPIEMYVPAFELSADPKSRTQSYYADAGAALLAATLDERPPLPEKLPCLFIDTDMDKTSSRGDANVFETPSTKQLPFSPLTTIGSPLDNSAISPMTPRAGRSLDRLTLMKRSKSVGPFPMPSRRSISLGRSRGRSLEAEAPPLPKLPATTYVLADTKQSSRPNSTSKTESAKSSTRRSSNSSSTSSTTSQSSQPSRGPSPNTQQTVAETNPEQEPEPETELEYLKPIAFQRRSTNAPIPITSSTTTSNNNSNLPPLPPLPSMPPQAYHFFPRTGTTTQTKANSKSISTHHKELFRSTSTENIRSPPILQQRSTQSLARSNSTYQPTTTTFHRYNINNNNSWATTRLDDTKPMAIGGIRKNGSTAELSIQLEPQPESQSGHPQTNPQS